MKHGEKAVAMIFFWVGMALGGIGGISLGVDLTTEEMKEISAPQQHCKETRHE